MKVNEPRDKRRNITLEAIEILTIHRSSRASVTAILYRSDFTGKISWKAPAYPCISLIVRGRKNSPYGIVMGRANIVKLRDTRRGEGNVTTGTARKCVTVTFDCASVDMLRSLEIPAPTTVVFGYRFGMWPPRGAFDEYSGS